MCNLNDIVRHVRAAITSTDKNAVSPTVGLMQQYTLEAMQDYAKNSGLLDDSMNFDLQSCVDDYTFPDCDDYKVGAILEVIDTRCPYPLEEGRDYKRDCNTIYLNRVPNCDVRNGLVVKFTKIPQLVDGKSCDVPAEFCDPCHYRPVVNRALFLLLSMPGTEWFNPNSAQFFQQEYDNSTTCERNSKRGKVNLCDYQPKNFC